MRYLADLLTFCRFILATILFVLAFTGGSIGAGLVIFLLGELTDAFDGACATRWPFPNGKAPGYRRYAAKYDMWTDTLLAVAMGLFFIMQVSLVGGLIVVVGYSALAIVIDLIVYGRVFGHPDDCAPRSLARRNFPLARKIILARRGLYLALMFMISVWTLYVSEWPLAVKNTIMLIALVVCGFLWIFLSQRRHNISRDAVEIERSLAKKHKNR